MFHKEKKLVQENLLMEKCWASHTELHTEENLVLMKFQGPFYHVDPLRILGLVTLSVKGLERVIF